jgi:hypothetical protein
VSAVNEVTTAATALSKRASTASNVTTRATAQIALIMNSVPITGTVVATARFAS